MNRRACQVAGVVMTFLLVAVMHKQSDGLWFQGDAPRHAVNGLFWWDLVRALPRDPVAFAVRYYARYPVIAPATYPPLFYLVEGVAFAAFGPSPFVAKSVVTLFGALAGFYTMAWARRWIGPVAGWAGAFLAVIPGIVVWSNAVMLNVPAAALGLATLYHFRRWIETARITQLATATCFLMAVLLTYYPGGSVLAILGAWGVLAALAPSSFSRGPRIDLDRRWLWIPAVALIAAVPLVAALWLAPVHTSRQLPTIAFLTSRTTWTFYWGALPDLIGRPVLALGTASVVGGLLTPRWRTEAAYLGSWILALILALSLLAAREPRYVLLAAPAFTIAAAMGVVWAARWASPAILMACLAAGLWSAARVDVPQVSGFRDIATDLRQRAPTDAVFYDGTYDGLFGFYVRVSDPNFERRLVLANKVLYEVGPTTTFRWIQRSNVATTDEVVQLLRSQSGCRWVAIEVDGTPGVARGQRLLRQAVERSEFELVRSFPITGAGNRRVDLYRLRGDVTPVSSMDLRFPSLSNREFLHVVPIAR